MGSLRPENAIFSQSGLANNWAMGFESCRDSGGGGDGPEGEGLFQRCMEGVRKEAERSCWLNSLLMTHSLAGGTGSGLGSGVLQASERRPTVPRDLCQALLGVLLVSTA